MSNHILLEVPPMPEGGITDGAVNGSKEFVNVAFVGGAG
jgi:hypothetical protein